MRGLCSVVLMFTLAMLSQFIVLDVSDLVNAPIPAHTSTTNGDGEVGAGPPAIPSVVDGRFMRNLGQMGGGAGLFYAMGLPLSVSFGEGWVSYVLMEDDPSTKGACFRTVFVGANRVTPVGGEPVGATMSMMMRDDPSHWIAGIPNYGSVVYKGLWDGIDLRFRFSQGDLKYDFIVSPGASPSQIAVEYVGIERLDIEPGSRDLVIGTACGELRDARPSASQVRSGEARAVQCGFRLIGPSIVGFAIGPFDDDRTLLIDPGLAFSTFLGGYSVDSGRAIAIDGQGSVFVSGMTKSDPFPTTVGAFDRSYAGDYDLFVTKLNASGASLDWSTYIGGSGRDEVAAIHLKEGEGLYIAGCTNSTDFPTTAGALSSRLNGSLDAFVVKMALDGRSLAYSTLLGGAGNEAIDSITVDSAGCAFATGWTARGGFPTTPGAFNTSTQNDNKDIFVTKLDGDGSSLVYSSVLGGEYEDRAGAIEVDEDGTAVICGYTSCDDFPTTEGAYCTTTRSNIYYYCDVLVVRLAANGSVPVFSTLVSGSHQEWAEDLTIADDGSIYVVGATNSVDFPSTSRAFCQTFSNTIDVFVLRLDGTGAELESCTGLGGNGREYGYSIDLDKEGTVYVAGITTSADFPCVNSTTKYVGSDDLFVAALGADLGTLLYSGCYGTDSSDSMADMEVDAGGSIFATGTSEDGFPTTKGAYRRSAYGFRDVYILLLDIHAPRIVSDRTPDTVEVGKSLRFNFSLEDKTGIQSAMVEVWFGHAPVFWNQSLALKNGTARFGDYDSVGGVPATCTTFPVIHYALHAQDLAGGWLNTTPRCVTVLDHVAPVINDLVEAVPTTGDPFVFTANVNDNVGVSSVELQYWFDAGRRDVTNLTMAGSDVDWLGNGEYCNYPLTVPANATGSLFYRYFAVDYAGGSTATIERKLAILDNDDPELLADLSGTVATTGDVLHLGARVRDNVGVSSVMARLVLTPSTPGTVDVGLDPEGPSQPEGRIFGLDYPVPSDATGLRYQFTARDLTGNELEGGWASFVVKDNDPPTLRADLSDAAATTGDGFRVEVEIDENTVLTEVLVSGFAKSPVALAFVNLTPAGTSIWSVLLTAPADTVAGFSYTISAIDTWGNYFETEPRTVAVSDNDSPALTNDTTPGTALRGTNLTFSIDAVDNVDGPGGLRVGVEYWYSEDTVVNATLAHRAGASPYTFGLTIDVARYHYLPLRYRFLAGDSRGNWNATTERNVTLVNAVPYMLGTPIWNVTEGIGCSFNLTRWLFDPNDDLTDLEIEVSLLAVEVRGLLLWANFTWWVPDTLLTVTAFDGDAYGNGTIMVRVTDVNDPPVIHYIFPADGTAYRDTDVIPLAAMAMDEEGDALTYLWFEGSGQIGSGNNAACGPLPAGRHYILLRVDDGTDTTTQVVTINITGSHGGEGQGDDDRSRAAWPWSIVLGLALVSALAVAAILLRRRRRHPG